MDNAKAKELEDAGFQVSQGDCPECGSYVNNKRFPTLSELIEACGDKFNTLERIRTSWTAQGGGEEGYGGTPEEAVSNLWLALNKK